MIDPRPIKFFNIQTLNDIYKYVNFEQLKKRMVDCLMFVLATKLMALKNVQKVKQGIFGNVHLSVAKASDELDRVQGLINNASYTDFLREKESKAHCFLDETLHMKTNF